MIKRKLYEIIDLLPVNQRSKFKQQLSLSLVNALLDLISVALVIPLLLIILDPLKLNQYLPFSTNSSGADNQMIYLILAVVSLFVIKNIFQLYIVRQFFNYIFGISTALSMRIASNHLQTNNQYVKDKSISEFYHNIRASCVDFSSKILFSLFSLISESFVLLVLFATSLFLFPLVSAIIFGVGLLLSYVIFAMKKRGVMNYNEKYIKYFHENTDQSFNLYKGKLDIFLNEAETNYLNLFESSLTNMNDQLATAHFWRFSNTKILELISVLFLIGGVIFYINYQTNYDPLMVSFFGAVSFKFLPSFIKLLNAFTEFKAYSHTIELMNESNDSVLKKKDALTFNNQIQLKAVSFGYEPNQIVLKNINLLIHPGDFIGIHGNSGLGKTTLLKLITGFYQVTKGRIEVDEVPSSKENTMSQFTNYVSQSPYLFKGTILNNIVIDRNTDVDFERINALIDLFELQSLIKGHPDGLNRELSSDDHTLSTGQKQRLAFIRALYSKPRLLLLDESTSHVEPRLAYKIFDYLTLLAENDKIAIVSVSHNPDLDRFYKQKFFLNFEGVLQTD